MKTAKESYQSIKKLVESFKKLNPPESTKEAYQKSLENMEESLDRYLTGAWDEFSQFAGRPCNANYREEIDDPSMKGRDTLYSYSDIQRKEIMMGEYSLDILRRRIADEAELQEIFKHNPKFQEQFEKEIKKANRKINVTNQVKFFVKHISNSLWLQGTWTFSEKGMEHYLPAYFINHRAKMEEVVRNMFPEETKDIPKLLNRPHPQFYR